MDNRERKSELKAYITFLCSLSEKGHDVDEKIEQALNELHGLVLK